jgi:hypothetical protein
MYQVANVIIFFGSLWAAISRRVPTGMFGSVVLWFLCMAALGNMVEVSMCHSWAEAWIDNAGALCIAWAFWRIEIHPRWPTRRVRRQQKEGQKP